MTGLILRSPERASRRMGTNTLFPAPPQPVSNRPIAMRTLRFGILAALALGAALAPAVAVAQRQPVDLELILMVDGSGSVDDLEFTLQRQGYIQALSDPRIIDAIGFGPNRRIALAYVEWSGPLLQAEVAPWQTIATAEDMAAFVQRLEQKPRLLYSGGTAVGAAIYYGVAAIIGNGFEGRRQVIDVSGDGANRNGPPANEGRDLAVAQGMTVNGLPILEDEPGLNDYYERNVIGGPGAFSIPARTFKDFATAIRMKLIREIAGAEGFEGTEVAGR